MTQHPPLSEADRKLHDALVAMPPRDRMLELMVAILEDNKDDAVLSVCGLFGAAWLMSKQLSARQRCAIAMNLKAIAFSDFFDSTRH
jgi:hypothetical protein